MELRGGQTRTGEVGPARELASGALALLRCGRLAAAREQAGRAAVAAEEEGDAVSLALASLGLGGMWLAEERSPIGRERYLSLLRRAHAELPPHEEALRLRLAVRRAAEVAYQTGADAELDVLIDAARTHGDPALLTEALSHYHHTMLGPARRHERAAVAGEMLRVAALVDDRFSALVAMLWLTVDQFLAGNPQAPRSLAELQERAAAIGGCHVTFVASAMEVMLLQRAGRLDDAERAAEATFHLGMEVGDPDAVAYYGGQLVTLRWIQGRAAEVLELAAEVEISPTITPLNEAFTASLASLAAAAGEPDRAQALLSRLRGRLHTIHQSSAWLVTQFSVVEAAHVLGDGEIAREAAGLLAPYADLPVLGSFGVACLGSVRRALGLAAVTTGDMDAGIRLLHEAVDHDERLGNRPLAAMTMVSLARAHAARDHADDRTAAAALLDRAIREADAMDLPLRSQEWRELRAAVADGDAPSGPPAPVAVVSPEPVGPTAAGSSGSAGPTAPTDPGANGNGNGNDNGNGSSDGNATSANGDGGGSVGVIQHRGRSWMLDVDGRQVFVPELQGMTYLVKLLANPQVEIPAAVLVSNGHDEAATLAAVRPEQPLLDDAALATYRRRVAELEDELAEAESYADPERAAQARVELDALVDELARSTNHAGRSRTFRSSNERARTAVQKAVRRTLDHIESVDPTLGATLRQSIHTGRTCTYDPIPPAPTRWSLPT